MSSDLRDSHFDSLCGSGLAQATGSSAELRPLLKGIQLIAREARHRGLMLTELLLEAAAESIDEILRKKQDRFDRQPPRGTA